MPTFQTNPSSAERNRITISFDKMEAYLYLVPSEGVPYTVPFLIEYLNSQNVHYGIDTEILQKVILGSHYRIPVCVAKGSPSTPGEDGYFEYKFRTTLDNKPKLLPDGSVDYRSVDTFETVKKGDVVAVYTPATRGISGFSVLGTIIPGKSGHDLPLLKGKGFKMLDDRRTYVAAIDGKIELTMNTLQISNMLNIAGDVDMATGDVLFSGDVFVQGNVLHGSTIRTNGNITVCGNVEDANLFASGNIELKSGMQGAQKGKVECYGNLSGKFFEQSILRVSGNLNANSIMNCDSIVQGRVNITGRHGIIVGGTTVCVGGVSATVIGNMSEIRTTIIVGITEGFSAEIRNLEKSIAEYEDRIAKTSLVLAKIETIKNPDNRAKLTTKKIQVMYTRKNLNRQLEELQETRQRMLDEANATSIAEIRIAKYLFPNVSLCINGISSRTASTYTNVIVKSGDEALQIINNI